MARNFSSAFSASERTDLPTYLGLSPSGKEVISVCAPPGCKVIDEHKDGGYITPAEAEGDFTTYISRIRKDQSNKKAVNIWVVSDNLLKGAALNTVQIAEILVKKN